MFVYYWIFVVSTWCHSRGMSKLTAELIADSPQYMNPVKDWELSLRGNKIQVIENLGATLDQFDCIDLSNNEIRKLDGFPYLRRLKTILINNNRICRIGDNLNQSLPNLEKLVLTYNNLEELSDLNPLASITTLEHLSLLRNPVIHKPGYRSYVIFKMPHVRVLDFRRIRQREREKAQNMFGGKEGEEKLKAMQRKNKTFVPGDPVASKQVPMATSGPTPEDIARIREAIANAKSLEEVQHLEAMLKSGQIPGLIQKVGGATNGEEEEEMEQETSRNGIV